MEALLHLQRSHNLLQLVGDLLRLVGDLLQRVGDLRMEQEPILHQYGEEDLLQRNSANRL